jgi:hypothetical protein
LGLTDKQVALVRQQNDEYRQMLGVFFIPVDDEDFSEKLRAYSRNNMPLITRGVGALLEDNDDINELLNIVRSYNDFTPDNDPWGEHDFGVFTFKGEKCFWKIDYYSQDMEHGSPRPYDLEETYRILTIGLMEEY